MTSSGASKAIEAYLKQARAYVVEGQWQKAVTACQQVIEIEPKAIEAYQICGNALQNLGQFEKSIVCYLKALEANPELPEAYANLGNLYVKQEEWSIACQYYEQCLSLAPDFASVYRRLAKVWEKLGDSDKSWSYMFQALELEPEIMTAEQHLNTADKLYAKQKLEKALVFYRHAVQLERSDAAYPKIISILKQLGRKEEARDYELSFAKLTARSSSLNENSLHNIAAMSPNIADSLSEISVEPEIRSTFQQHEQLFNGREEKPKVAPQIQQKLTDPKMALKMGHLLSKQQQWHEAIDCYQQVIKLEPENASAYWCLGKAYQHLGAEKQAAIAYFRGSRLQPDRIDARQYASLGDKLLEADRVEQAEVCFREAIRLQPSSSDYLKLGQILAGKQDERGAADCYQQLLREQPNAEAYIRLGELAEARGENAAIDYYRRAIEVESNSGAAHHHLGDALSKRGNLLEAVESYRQAITIQPEFSWSYNNLGDAYFKLEQYTEAVECYRRAISLKDDFFWSHYNLGESLSKLFRWSEAIAAYRQAIELKPDLAEAYAHLGDALIREDDWDGGIEYYERAIEINPGIDVAVYRNLKEALDRRRYLAMETESVTPPQPWPYWVPKVYPPFTSLPDGSPLPKISIVTPTYDRGEFIEETILSVINQNYPNLEYILIDGGSTDGTMEVVARYREHFSHVVSEPDRGQSNAINKGFALATGEIYTWLNSDDRLAPGALYAIALAFYTSGADAVAGICQIYQDGREIERHLTSCSNDKISLTDILDLENCWLQGKFFYQPEVMFTRAIWEKAGGKVEEDLYYSMDYEMWARFAAHGAKLQVIGYPVAQYRLHEQQKTSAIEKYRPELLQVRQSLQERYNISPLEVAANSNQGRKQLKIVVLNDTGCLGGAGIAHQRIAKALQLAGHQVFPVAGTLDWSLTPVDCTIEEVTTIVASLDPDLLVIGNIHNFQAPLDILETLASLYPTVFIMHDQWLLTGRCGYTGDCQKYATLCDRDCPTWDEYPRLAPTKIAPAFQRKQALLQSDRLLVLGDSQWLTDWAGSSYQHHAGADESLTAQKFASMHYGLDLSAFLPQDREDARRQLGLPEDRFIILTGSQSLEDERKGFKYLLRALEIADLPDVLLLCFGHEGDLDTMLEVKNVGYVNKPELLAFYYSAADLFVSPALEEAFGQTLIEAAACGTPTVGFAVGGVGDAIGDRISGRLVSEKTPAALAMTIIELYGERSELERLRQFAPWYVANNFSYASSYHSIIDAWATSGYLARLGMSAVTKLAVEAPPSNFLTVKGGDPQSITSSPAKLPRRILMNQFLQGSGWYPTEVIEGVSARWMKKQATVVVSPIASTEQLAIEISGLTAVDLNLLDKLKVKVDGRAIKTTRQNGDCHGWVCRGKIEGYLLPQRVAFLITLEVDEIQQLSSQDTREGSLLIESITIEAT